MIASMKITTTAACTMRCRGCSVEAWRGEFPQFDMTLEQVVALVAALGDERVGELIVSGGEPMLWKPLPDAVEMLRPLCDRIIMFSNGTVHPDGAFVRATSFMDEVRVSVFPGNAANVEKLRSWSRCKVRGKKKGKFWLRPDAPVVGSLPADCRCPHIEICGDRAYACSLVQHNAIEDGNAVPEGMVADVSPGFVERLNRGGAVEMPMCARCVGNKRISCAKVSPC